MATYVATTGYDARAITRRKFLTYAAAVAAAGASGQLLRRGWSPSGISAEEEFEYRRVIPGVARGHTSTKVYHLDPEWGVGTIECAVPHAGSRACHACVACHAHAEHKFFATERAADDGRAHPHCKCLIYSNTVTEAAFTSLFGVGGSRGVVFDTRKDTLS